MAKKNGITAKRAKELKRVKQFIRRAKKRGYKFTEEFIASLTSRTTRSLQTLTPRKLYEQSLYEVYPGVFVEGKFGRNRERELSAIKAKETKEAKKREQLRREREERERAGAPGDDGEYIPTEEEITYYTVIGIINDNPSSDGATYLKNLLDSEIRKFGLYKVMRSMAESDRQIIKLAHEIIYYELTSGQLHEALQEFSALIRGGAIMSKEESKRENEVLENISDES